LPRWQNPVIAAVSNIQDNCCPQGLLGSKCGKNVFRMQFRALALIKKMDSATEKLSSGKMNFYLVILSILILFVISCEKAQKGIIQDSDSSLTGNAIAKIYHACKYDDEQFCDSECCGANEICNGKKSFKECDLQTGKWKEEIFADSNCRSKCGDKASEEESPEISVEQRLNETIIAGKTTKAKCEQGWKCKDEYNMDFFISNCSIISSQYCERGCVNDSCVTLCKKGELVCKGNVLRICDEEGASYSFYKECGNGCEGGKCIEAALNDNNATQAANQTQNSSQQNVCGSNCIEIFNFHYDADGNDCNNLNDEYVIFKNKCDFSCDMAKWNVSDDASHSYAFPIFTAQSGKIFTLYTGAGTDTSAQLYWNSKYNPCKAVWNNDKDVLYLRNEKGELILTKSYP